jgi:hypothetical protein
MLKDRIIFISGGTYISGINDFFSRIKNIRLNKPFTREELLQAISIYQHEIVNEI